MTRVNVAEAKARLSELIAAALNGEEVVIARRNVPVVKLTVVTSARRRCHVGALRGLVWIADDFDAPLPELAEYSG
jgi:prevent-host-death family protein